MGKADCGIRNGKIAKLQKLLNWEYEISPIRQSAFPPSPIPHSAIRNSFPIAEFGMGRLRSSKNCRIGNTKFPQFGNPHFLHPQFRIPQSAIRNSFVGLSPALQRRRHPTNGYFCKGVRSAIVTVEYGDTGRFPASRRRAGVWTFQHLSRWRYRRIPRSKSHERGMSSGLTANSSARYCSASVRSNW